MSNIRRNLGLQTLYQLLNTCLPLITAPYLARVLGAEKLGVFSFTSSVVAYFALFAMLGTVNYGTRSIASVKDTKQSLSVTFWSIYTLQFIVSISAIILYVGYMLVFCKNNTLIAWIQLITLISCVFDINWLFFGVENFKLTVTRSMVIRILTVASILVFVKKPDDLWVYTVIMLGGTLLSQVILWLYLPRMVNLIIPSAGDVWKHFKPNIILFIPILAMTVYHVMDKTMLGILSSYEETGYYYNSDKIINIPLGVLNGVGTVMLPRMTALISENRKKDADDLFVLSIEGIGFVGVAISFGIAAISNEFVPLFFGPGYEKCILLTIVLAPVLVVKGFSNTTRTQYLIPYQKESVFTKSVVIGAIVNLIANILLIPSLGALGAVIGTLTAEVVSCIWQFIYIWKDIPLKAGLINTLGYVVIGVMMFFAVRAIAMLPIRLVFFKLIVEIGIGGIVFVLLSILFWKASKNHMYEVIFGGVIGKIPLLNKIL